jgi:hypothetical protein
MNKQPIIYYCFTQWVIIVLPNFYLSILMGDYPMFYQLINTVINI